MAKKVKPIKVKALDARMVNVARLTPFQGAFKELQQHELVKLQGELVEQGILKAFTVWEYKKDHYKVLDGHQRLVALQALLENQEATLEDHAINEDVVVQNAVPIELVAIEDAKEAAAACLALGSTYGTPRGGGMARLAKKAGLTAEEAQQRFSFPGIDPPEEEDGEEGEDGKGGKAPTTSGWKNGKVVKCPNCQQQFYQKNHPCTEPEEGKIWQDGTDD